jgi:hypothetical protein
MNQTKQGRLRPLAGRGSFLASLREFLTPAVWKQAHQARRALRRSARWTVQPLILTLLVMTWCCGDSQSERFETAKAFCAACLPKRRRPGRTVHGFHKALARLPLAVLQAVAAGIRRRLWTLLDWYSDGWVVLGCDGSRLECPRVAELEQRLGTPVKPQAAPMIWVTALVHLRSGVPWAWRLDKGTTHKERDHLRDMLGLLPAQALVVADAGFNGYDLAQALVSAGASFLIRMAGNATLYVDGPAPGKNFRDGMVWCWSTVAQQRRRLPLRVRLIRVRSQKKQAAVWLLTNVLDSQRLPAAQAARYYRWRWENEGFFRTYKRTLAKVKLHSRTVRLVYREAEGALLATQLLLAQAARVQPQGRQRETPRRCSARKALLAIRAVIAGRLGPSALRRFQERLKQARRERRRRTSPKVKRAWPRRVDHPPPTTSPRFRTLTDNHKALIAKLESTAA